MCETVHTECTLDIKPCRTGIDDEVDLTGTHDLSALTPSDNWYNAGLWDNSTGKAMKGVAAVGTFSYSDSGDDPEPTEKEVYILGEVNGNSWATNVGVQMSTTDHITYTATITTTGEWDGDSYFGLTTARATEADDWNGIAASRFGPVSDGNFLVNNDLLGATITLTNSAYPSFQIAAGTFSEFRRSVAQSATND